MRWRKGCGYAIFGLLVIIVACAVFAALAWGLVRTGELSLYAPRVTSVQPEAGYPFQPTTPITLTFDQPMDPASVEAVFSLEPDAPGVLRWNESYEEMVFVPVEGGWAPGTTYTFRLESGAKGWPLPRTTDYTIVGRFFLPPLLDSTSPEPTAEEFGPWPLLQATFNFALNCEETLQTFSITPEAEGSPECDGYTVSYSPTLPLEPGTRYVAELGSVYLEGDDWPRDGVRWELQTAPPLTVVEVSPAEEETLSDLWAPVRVSFSQPVAVDSIVERFALVDMEGATVPGRVTWDDSGATFVFKPENALVPASSYQATLDPGLRDEMGFALAEGLSRTFHTEPMLGQVWPLDGAAEVSLDETVIVSFTRAMDQDSALAGLTFSPTLEGEATWDGNTLIFAPRTGFEPDTQYEAILSEEIRDESAAPLAHSHRWTFTTEPFLLDTQVLEQEVTALQEPISFTFALPMDRASVQAGLAISPSTAGELIWSEGDRSVTFKPDPGWLSGTQYEITLDGSTRTADGHHTLGEDRSWEFSTAPVEVQFGYGSNVQVMDAGGERTFQLVVRGADVADFELYPITPTQFLDVYSSGFRGIGPEEPQVLDTTSLTPTLTWREPLTPDHDQIYGDWWVASAHLPPEVPPGMYILASATQTETVDAGFGSHHLLVVLTNHTLVLKRALAGAGDSTVPTAGRSEAQIVVWDTELSGGAPVVSATVRIYDRDGSFLAEGVTDANGLLVLDVPGDPAALMALATTPTGAEDNGARDSDVTVGDVADGDVAVGDVTVSGLSDEWSHGGWWWWLESASRPLYTIYSYTDRPIYRPGQTVYFKDWIRPDEDVSYTLPAPDLPVTVRLRDARDNVAATQVLSPTQFGTVHGEFQLADEPMLGPWNLETEVDGTITRQPFEVEEYRKPEYEVAVSIPEKVYVNGEAISVTIDANYYFGQPVAGAEVMLVGYPAYPEEYYYGEPGTRFGYPVYEEKGRTDTAGRWTVVVPTEEVFYSGSEAPRALLALEATVTDESGQSVSSYQTVTVQRTSQGLALLLEQHGYEPNEEIRFSVQARDRGDEPVEGAELKAQIVGWDEQVVAEAMAATDASGQAHFSVSLADQGWYLVRVSGTDEGGRKMEAEDSIWIYDPAGQAPWYDDQGDEQTRLSVSADRLSYQVGDEAKVLVYSAVPGPALLSFERGETHDVWPVTLVSGTNFITVPIRSDYAPNVHLTINQYGPLGDDWWFEQSRPEAELHTASTQILVPMADRLLTVTLTADQENYGPGDEAIFQVQVLDYQGQPVVAEVSLGVVDEAIYALAEDMSKDPFDTFYGPRPNVVRTFDSLRPLRWLYPEGAGMGGGNGEVETALRRDFRDTAYWAPQVITDQNGEATIAITLPDNLTEWRAMARAVTTDTLVGQATTGVVVAQDIVVRPALPRFLVQGDAITLTAVVHNFTGQAVSATVKLDVEGLTMVAGDEAMAQQVVGVPAGGSAVAGWPVVADEPPDPAQDVPGEARVTVQAVATIGARLVGRDAVELTLPVVPLVVPEIATFAGQLTRAQPTSTMTITLPSDAVEGLSRLEVNLAPSVAPGLLQGLAYLIDYPFG